MSYLGEEIKKLGFGLMRLPQKDGKIDIEQTKTMVDMFLGRGFYILRHRLGVCGKRRRDSSGARRTLSARQIPPRHEKPAWSNCKTREDAVSQFDTSLKQTGAGYFDFYLLHNLGESRHPIFRQIRFMVLGTGKETGQD